MRVRMRDRDIQRQTDRNREKEAETDRQTDRNRMHRGSEKG